MRSGFRVSGLGFRDFRGLQGLVVASPSERRSIVTTLYQESIGP